mmetsp:Transcript_13071/g.33693  ORF Transcript_13071/g.33693 Transcript_13071/m.33693 type:complete len:363 (+) Transcript_13071:37-1125(+)
MVARRDRQPRAWGGLVLLVQAPSMPVRDGQAAGRRGWCLLLAGIATAALSPVAVGDAGQATTASKAGRGWRCGLGLGPSSPAANRQPSIRRRWRWRCPRTDRQAHGRWRAVLAGEGQRRWTTSRGLGRLCCRCLRGRRLLGEVRVAQSRQEVVKVDLSLEASRVFLQGLPGQFLPKLVQDLLGEVALQVGAGHHLVQLVVAQPTIAVDVEDAEGCPASLFLLLALLVHAGRHELGIVNVAVAVHVHILEQALQLGGVLDALLLPHSLELCDGDDAVLVLVDCSEVCMQLTQLRLVKLPREHAGADVAQHALVVQGLHPVQVLQHRLLCLVVQLAHLHDPRVLVHVSGADALAGVHREHCLDQ